MKSIHDFFNSANEQKELLMELDRIISSCVPKLERKIYRNSVITMLGYGAGLDKDVKNGKLPIISIAPSKKGVHVYLTAYKNRQSIVDYYKDQLGKVSCGMLTVRIRKIEDLNIEIFKEMIINTVVWNERQDML